MLIIIKAKATDNIIGLKEDIAARLEGVADIVIIDVRQEEGEQKYFSPQEVRKMTPAQIHENYQHIMDSMKKWD